MSVMIRTNDRFKWGQKNVIPFVGLVEISKEGEVEVPNEEVAKKISELGIGFEFQDQEATTTTTTIAVQETTTTTTIPPVTKEEDLAPKTEQNDLGKEQENELGAANENPNEDLLKSLDTLKVEELQKLAQTFPKEEWTGKKKAELIEYLKGKLA